MLWFEAVGHARALCWRSQIAYRKTRVSASGPSFRLGECLRLAGNGPTVRSEAAVRLDYWQIN
jgi:hypothetical protein